MKGSEELMGKYKIAEELNDKYDVKYVLINISCIYKISFNNLNSSF
jgi:hypothetical protein